MSLVPRSCTESAPDFLCKSEFVVWIICFVLAGDERLGFVVPVLLVFSISPLLLAEDEGLDCGAELFCFVFYGVRCK